MQIMSSRQWATGLVLCYPFFPVFENWLSDVAGSRGEPSMEEVAQAALQDPLDAEWEQLDKYVVQICSDYLYEYVPMPRLDRGLRH